MLDFSNEFKNGKTRISKAWLDITLSDSTVLNLDESRVMFNGLSRDTSTTMDGEFTVGAAVTTKLTVSLDNSDNALDAYDFRGAVIVAWLGGTLTSGNVQKVNIGRYNVSEYSYDGSCINLVALDDLCKFDMQCVQTVNWGSGKTIADLVGLACAAATIDLYNNSLPGPANYTVTQMPEQWETMTWHDVISYCAQIMGCFAHMVYVPNPGTWKLKFDWYDMSSLTPSQFDGGTYDTTTTPYSDGATLDGGSFDPWNTGDVADGGTFHDRDNLIILPAPYDMTIDTDDVMITGVTVTLDPSDNIEADDDTKTYTTDIVGSAGYVINIEENPLIETMLQADIVAAYLGALLNGMRFRPMTISAIEDPSLEAGDVAFITDRNGNTYAIFLSHVTYTVNASTQISCDAQTTMQNLKSRYSGAQKTRAMIQRTVEKTASDAENAMSGIIGALATTMGLYKFEETAPDGSTIYKFGDAQTLAASTKIWRFSAGALTVSNDGGTTWSAALSADGIAVLQALYAVKVNADLIEAGAFTTKDSLGNETFYADTATGVVRINAQSVSITGRTVDNIAQGYATTAENNAKTAAQGYANTAESNAVNTASADATAKANAAKSGAEATAAADATAKANAAKSGAEATAAADATQKANAAEQAAKNYSNQQLMGYAQEVSAQFDSLFETWFYDGVPTLSNLPASSWTDTETKDAHVGDLYFDTTGGYAYKFTKTNSVYSWVQETGSGITTALADAANAQDTANHKRRVFVAQPTNADAYDVGDLWVNATYGTTYTNDILRCKTAKTASTNFNISHWELASKYTDDSALTTWLTNTYASDKSSLESQIDEKIETWYQASDPASSWSDNATKAKHVGDLWYCTNATGTYAGKYWQYTYESNAYSWKELKATPPSGVMDEIDGKANIFTGSTTPSGAEEGDLWFKGTTEPILTYVNGSWVTYNKYTDDTLIKSQFGVCSTSDIVQVKNVYCDTFDELYAGARITVKFQYRNTAHEPKLDVNSTGAKYIHANGANISQTGPFNWEPDALVDFVYDGTYWNMSDSIALSARPSYGTCPSNANMASKEVVINGFALYKGAKISVLFSKANTAANPTLNVNSTGAYYIHIRGAAPTAKDYWKANAVLDFIFDGTYWEMCNIESQQEIFNRLTASDNGTQQGIYLDNGKLYLNFEYAQGQTLKLGGVNNTNGLLEVYNANNQKIVTVDHLGVRNTKESITDTNDGFILNNSGLSIGDFSVSPVRRYVESRIYGRMTFGDARLDYLWSLGTGNGEITFTADYFAIEATDVSINASGSFRLRVGDEDGCRSLITVYPPTYYGGSSAQYGVRFDLVDQMGYVAHHWRQTNWYAYNE